MKIIRFNSEPLTANSVFRDIIDNTYTVAKTIARPFVEESNVDEILQEAYTALYLKMQKSSIENPSGYFLKIVRNMAISRYRKEKLGHDVIDQMINPDGDDVHLSAEEQLIDDQQNRCLIDAINLLPPVCRQVFIYRKIEEKSHQEIAQIMEISTKTVENHLAKGLKLVRETMLKDRQMSLTSKKVSG